MSCLHLNLRRSQCTPGQWAFLQCDKPVVLLSGGFGAGKTLGLGLKVLQLKSINPHVPGLLMAQSWRSLWSITYRRLMGFLRQTLPASAMPKLVDKQGECYLDFGDGVPVFLRSAHDPACFDGLDVGWACGDEPRHWQKVSHDVLLGRVRVKCALPQLAYSSTPRMNWLADEFDSGKKDRALIRAPTSENLRNLAPNFIDNLRLSYSRRMQQAVIEGLFVQLEGAVYEQVDFHSKDSPWVVDYHWRGNLQRKTYLAVDPGFRKSAYLFIHEITPTSWVVFKELMLDETSDDAAVQLINDLKIPIDEIWCDPAADATQSTTNLDTIDLLNGIKLRGRNSNICHVTGPFRSIPYGVDKTRVLLGDPEGIGQPIRVRFARELLQNAKKEGVTRGCYRDITGYSYPEEKDGKKISDMPLKDGRTDHCNDAFRNWAVGMWLTSPLRDVDDRLSELRSSGFVRT